MRVVRVVLFRASVTVLFPGVVATIAAVAVAMVLVFVAAILVVVTSYFHGASRHLFF